jgi:outer membrane lipoprotein-sorting protein
VLAGLLILVPLTLAVLANFGLMGLTGIRLNIATAVISAMAVGIGADYAIYLISRLREELARGVDERVAFRGALVTAGKAILFVASAVAGGYGVLVFSYGFYIHMWLALLIATAMLVSSLGALTILPSLIIACRPRFVFGSAPPRPLLMAALPAAALVGLGLGLLPGGAGAAPLTAREIMEKNHVSTRVQDSISDATFTLINKNGQERVRKTVGLTKLQPNGLDNRRMTRFVAPPDIRGTATLLIEHSDRDDEMWVYLPALRKVRRLVSSNKKDSFVGTDFSYGDVIGHKVEDWEHRLHEEAMVEGRPCYVIESLPRTDAVRMSSGYAKRLTYVRKDNYVTSRAEFWDQAGQPLKVFTAGDVQLVDPVRGKWQPMRREMVNVQTGHQTIVRNEHFKANQAIHDDRFTTRYLERDP